MLVLVLSCLIGVEEMINWLVFFLLGSVVLGAGCSRTMVLPTPVSAPAGGSGVSLSNGTGLLLSGGVLSLNVPFANTLYLGLGNTAVNSFSLAGLGSSYYLNVSGSFCSVNGTNCPLSGGSGWVNTSTNVSLVDLTDNVSLGALRVDNTNLQALVNGSLNVTSNLYLHGVVSSYSPMVFQTDGTTRMVLNDTSGTLDEMSGMRLYSAGAYVAGMNMTRVWWPGNVTLSLGGGLLLAGTCVSGTTRVVGARVGDVVLATPSVYPGDGSDWKAYVSSNDTITVKVCALVALTPVASVYNARVVG